MAKKRYPSQQKGRTTMVGINEDIVPFWEVLQTKAGEKVYSHGPTKNRLINLAIMEYVIKHYPEELPIKIRKEMGIKLCEK